MCPKLSSSFFPSNMHYLSRSFILNFYPLPSAYLQLSVCLSTPRYFSFFLVFQYISYSSFIFSSLLSVSLSFPLFRFHPSPFQVNRIPNFAILVCSCFHVRLRVKSFNVGKVQSPTSMYCEADFYSSHFWGSKKVALHFVFIQVDLK